MKITYGICVSPDYNPVWLDEVLYAIVRQYYHTYDDYEILLVGGGDDLKDGLSYRSDTIAQMSRCIPFDEIRPGWITAKKNIIAREARYENLCIMHDYVKIGMKWREGVEQTALNVPDWQIMLNRVYTAEMTRGPDWLVDPKYMLETIAAAPEFYTKLLMDAAPHENGPQYVSGLPYLVRHLSPIQYVSGAYFLVKRQLLLDNPFNESMIWGDAPGEDVEWSRRLAEKCVRYTWNDHSAVAFIKPKKWHLIQMPDQFVDALTQKYGVH